MIKTRPTDSEGCVSMPDFERLQYYYGRSLTVADFQAEQQYFLEKLRLHNRCFHGTGIVCGLEVHPAPAPDDCDSHQRRERREIEQEQRAADVQQATPKTEEPSKQDRDEPTQAEVRKEIGERRKEELPDCDDREETPPRLSVDCGWAIDCHGREIIVRRPQTLELHKLLSADDRRTLEQHRSRMFVLSVCYCEQETYRTRPVVRDSCEIVDPCKYGRVREGYRFTLTLLDDRAGTAAQVNDEHPTPCSNCCDPCEQECVVLAHIRWDGKSEVTVDDIQWQPRRDVSVVQPTVITEVSWQHGARYSREVAADILGTNNGGGIEVRFSNAVYAETLQPGVVDLWRIQGGRGLAGLISHIEGDYVDKPPEDRISRFRYRDCSGEPLANGDRVLITIRTNFILDTCCRPVDGDHVGGLVPQLDGYGRRYPSKGPERQMPICAKRPNPWTTGNGRPGATFESWFFIDDERETRA